MGETKDQFDCLNSAKNRYLFVDNISMLRLKKCYLVALPKMFLIVSFLSHSPSLIFHFGFRLRKIKSSKFGGKFYDVRVLNWLRNFITFEHRKRLYFLHD